MEHTLALIGLAHQGIKRQEIQFLRRIQDLSTVWQKDF